MSDLRDAARMALLWLKWLPDQPHDAPYWTNGMFAKDVKDAVESIRAALSSEPAQAEPVAVFNAFPADWQYSITLLPGVPMLKDGTKLHAAPPKREPQHEGRTPMDRFENAIREVGVVAACEWFGHRPDSEFTKETQRVLNERAITGA